MNARGNKVMIYVGISLALVMATLVVLLILTKPVDVPDKPKPVSSTANWVSATVIASEFAASGGTTFENYWFLTLKDSQGKRVAAEYTEGWSSSETIPLPFGLVIPGDTVQVQETNDCATAISFQGHSVETTGSC